MGSEPVIGWREWISLPDLGIPAIKAKVDTGARSSALHAFDVVTYERRGKRMVRFKVHPYQRNNQRTVETEAELIDERVIRNSGGEQTKRPVIITPIELNGQRWMVEITLASRDSMGFRMLLGRQAIRGRFVIDPGRAFLFPKPVRAPKRAGRRRNQRKETR